ncbi:hypothetical protein LX36DRAFT_242127 [Colletotrichum falcatum]|nr:hypothetical protein LX36DRAFT_242127 [Colletotrichum falcatum]
MPNIDCVRAAGSHPRHVLSPPLPCLPPKADLDRLSQPRPNSRQSQRQLPRRRPRSSDPFSTSLRGDAIPEMLFWRHPPLKKRNTTRVGGPGRLPAGIREQMLPGRLLADSKPCGIRRPAGTRYREMAKWQSQHPRERSERARGGLRIPRSGTYKDSIFSLPGSVYIFAPVWHTPSGAWMISSRPMETPLPGLSSAAGLAALPSFSSSSILPLHHRRWLRQRGAIAFAPRTVPATPAVQRAAAVRTPHPETVGGWRDSSAKKKQLDADIQPVPTHS